MSKRIVELDLFRGIAVVLMVIFHAVFDLAYYFGFEIDYARGFWYYEGRLSAISFMFIAGISSCLSRNPARRGIKLFLFGMGITAVTYFWEKANYIKFGILHFLGTSYLLSVFFKNLNSFLLVLVAALLFAAGTYFDSITTANPYLFPLGITTPYFSSLDYYPLVPYFGVFLLGIAFGKEFYARGHRVFRELGENVFSLLGRHSLFVYLIHQPLILLFLHMARKSGIL